MATPIRNLFGTPLDLSNSVPAEGVDLTSPVTVTYDPKFSLGRVMSETLKIWVTFALHGMHRYPDAPDEVAYLRNEHRHLFQFKVTVSVIHDDREVEFHMLQNWCKAQYAESILELNHKSCEMIARDLMTLLTKKYGDLRSYEVEVSEDGECGAILTQSPTHIG